MIKQYHELKGVMLDYAVAVALGYNPKKMIFVRGFHDPKYEHIITQVMVSDKKGGAVSFGHADGGVAMDLMRIEGISVRFVEQDKWRADQSGLNDSGLCDSPEEAVSRCFVRACIGEEIEVPAELVGDYE